MYETQVDGLPGQGEAAVEAIALCRMPEGDFASGVRAQLADARVPGDVGRGLRTAPNFMVAGDFASGMRALAKVTGGRGDFAAGHRSESTRAARRAALSARYRGSSHWRGHGPLGEPGRP
jgi:hypothetical protein